MNRTIKITLNEIAFDIEEEAYEKLKQYMKSVEVYFSKEEAKDEIIKDIENNFASKLEEKLSRRKQQIVLEKDIEELIKIIGRVEDFEKEESESKDEKEKDHSTSYKKLYRNPDDFVIAGVCSGIASYLDIDPSLVRLIYVLFTIFTGFFPGVIIYIILWGLLPMAETGSQRLEMNGEIINLKSLKEKIYQMKDDIKKATMNEKNRSYIKQKVRNIKREFRNEIRKEYDVKTKNKREDIFYIIIKIILVIIGASILATAVGGLIGISVGLSFMIFSPSMLASMFSVPGMPLNQVQLISILGLITALIPTIFLLVAGISLIRGKNGFKVGSSVFMLFLWVFVISGLIFFSIRYFPYGPRMSAITINTTPWQDYNSINSGEISYSLSDFDAVKIEGPYSVDITKGDEFIVKAKGEDYVLKTIKVNVDSKVLKISPKDIFGTITNNVAFEIQVPELNKIELNGATKLNLSGFDSNDNLDLELNGASFAKLDFYSKNVSINLNGLSRVEFEESDINKDKQIESLKLESNGASSSDFTKIQCKSADINVMGASNVKINSIETLKIKADGASSIEYMGNPKMNQKVNGLSSIKKIEDKVDAVDSETETNTSSF